MDKRLYFFVLLAFLAGCQTPPEIVPEPVLPPPPPVEYDDEIIVEGQRFRTGTHVVTWKDEGGLNAYVFQPTELAGKENHGVRRLVSPHTDNPLIEPTEPWNLVGLQNHIDQFVLHYDSEGLSHRTFEVLQRRGLSAHFLLDVDGTIYQTLDLRERAYHATVANSRSIGIEIANVGAYPPTESKELNLWYKTAANGQIVVSPPPELAKSAGLPAGFVARPVRADPVLGNINGHGLIQYDFTAEQYVALIKLTAALHKLFPLIKLDYPRDDKGLLLREKLHEQAWDSFQGVLGHMHIQENKVDPGPAFQWDHLIEGARAQAETKE